MDSKRMDTFQGNSFLGLLSNTESLSYPLPGPVHHPMYDFSRTTSSYPIYQNQAVQFPQQPHYHYKCGSPACYTLPSPFYYDRLYNTSAHGIFYPFANMKPSLSYVGLISEAILNSAEKKVLLSDIYDFLLVHYPYFRTRTTGWRNSIRHNLSLNSCFVKAGRSANGKGHYWTIHSDYLEDFLQGKFKKRKAKGTSEQQNKTRDKDNSSQNNPSSQSEIKTDTNALKSTFQQSSQVKNSEKDYLTLRVCSRLRTKKTRKLVGFSTNNSWIVVK